MPTTLRCGDCFAPETTSATPALVEARRTDPAVAGGTLHQSFLRRAPLRFSLSAYLLLEAFNSWVGGSPLHPSYWNHGVRKARIYLTPQQIYAIIGHGQHS